MNPLKLVNKFCFIFLWKGKANPSFFILMRTYWTKAIDWNSLTMRTQEYNKLFELLEKRPKVLWVVQTQWAGFSCGQPGCCCPRFQNIYLPDFWNPVLNSRLFVLSKFQFVLDFLIFLPAGLVFSIFDLYSSEISFLILDFLNWIFLKCIFSLAEFLVWFPPKNSCAV